MVTKTEAKISAPVIIKSKNNPKALMSKPLMKKNKIIPYKVSPQAETIVFEQRIFIKGSLGCNK